MPEKPATRSDYDTSGKPGESPQPAASQHVPDLSQITAAIEKGFANVRDQPSRPFDGAAKTAVETFNDILAGLRLKYPPDAPNLSATALSATEAKLTWENSTLNADGFKVSRCLGKDCTNFVEIANSLPSDAKEYQDDTLSGKTTVRYQLVAFNTRGETPSNIVEITTK